MPLLESGARFPSVMQVVIYRYLCINGREVPILEAVCRYEVVSQYLQTLLVHSGEDALQAEQGYVLDPRQALFSSES